MKFKKSITAVSITTLLALLFSLICIPAAAADSHTWVSDEADIISAYIEEQIDELAAEIKRDHGFNVYVATVRSLDFKTAEAYADDLYDSLFSLNSDEILLLISTEYRDYAVSTSGNAIGLFNEDQRIDKLTDTVVEYLREDDYSAAALSFVKLTRSCLDAVEAYEQSKTENADAWRNSYNSEIGGYWVEERIPDEYSSYSFAGIFKALSEALGGDVSGGYYSTYLAECALCFLGVLAAAMVIGFVWLAVMKSKMSNIRRREQAADYVRRGSFTLTQSIDRYLYSTVSKTPRAQSSSGGGGGGSRSHTSSSGASHGGRSGKF